MEYDLDAAAAAGGLRREVLNQALDDSTGLKKGADWEVAGGRIRMTPEALEMLLAGIGHRIETEALEAAKTAAQDSFWNRPGWRRMRVTNPWASRQLVLGYLMDTGKGVPASYRTAVCSPSDARGHKKAALASARAVRTGGKTAARKGRW